jgi:hypothetical protein
MSIKLSKYTIDRRDLFRLTAIGAGGMYLANLDAFAADAVCQTLKEERLSTDPMLYTTTGVTDPGDESASLFFLIDGTYTNFYLQDSADANLVTSALGGGDRSYKAMGQTEKDQLRILTKARVSIHCEFDQNDTTFIEAVILSDASHRILAMRRFTAGDFILLGNVRKTPYVVFDRLNLVEGAPLHVTYVRRIGTKATIYQYKIDGKDAGPSRLDFTHLPPLARSTLSSDFLGEILGGEATNDPLNRGSHSYVKKGLPLSNDNERQAAIPAYPFNGSGGYVANAYYNQRPVPLHSVRVRPVSINSNGNFRFEIEKMHGDINLGHYMRYFLVLDPVGRILGGLRRDHTGTTYDKGFGNTDGANSYIVGDGSVENAKAMNFKVSSYKITDMPHVQIITEDVLDAIGRITYRIR